MEKLVIEAPGKEQRAFNELSSSVSRRIAATPAGVCPVDLALSVLRLCHTQSCGKCTPCRIGLGQLGDLLEKVLEGNATSNALELIESTASSIKDSADCAIGYEAANTVLESLKYFRKDYEAHINNAECSCGWKDGIPCVAVCPAHVDIPGYIALVKAGRNEDAVRLIRKDNPFPAVCGYVCEHPCEHHCRRSIVEDAVNICGIKRYAVDHAGDISTPPCAEATGKKVAVIGGGPSGLTTAYFLTLMGHKVTVFEQRKKLGGMLRYGIPDYRLPQDVLDKDIQYILDTGVETVMETSVGSDLIDELKQQYDAVYLSIGAHDDKKLGIDGENSKNVISAVQLLRDAGEGNLYDFTGKKVCVIGGGNVAMDATRTSLRLGADKVTCVYRRRIEDMTALPEEVHEAQMEGAKIMILHAPDHIEADAEGKVAVLWAQPQIVSAIGKDGRTGVRKAEKDMVRIPCDVVIVAIGQDIHSQPFEEKGIATKWGRIIAEDSTYISNSGNVFAGGDAVSGPATVIRAIAAGKVAANNIDSFLGYEHEITVDVDIPAAELTNTPPCGRVNQTVKMIDEISGDFSLVSEGMSEQEMEQECSRCLRCDHFGYGIFKGGRNPKW